MSFSDAFEAPIIEKIGGADVTFPLLAIDDYIPWTAELHAQRKTKSKALIPANSGAIDRFRMQRIAEFDEPTLDAIGALVWTAPGARKVLDLSLAKAGKATEERTALLKAVPPRRLIGLAVEVSALFQRNDEPQETPDPNSPGPAAAAG